MTTVRQLQANRRNALQSTGPRTQRGKNIASLNAARHGLYANAPVIPRLENPAHWEQHRARTIENLAPSGALEHALAERVALILWRLGRVARYEQNVTTIAQRHARADLETERPSLELDDDDTPDDVRDRLAHARRRLDALPRLAVFPPTAPMSGKQAEAIFEAVAAQIEGYDLEHFSAPHIVPEDVPWIQIPDWTIDRVHQVIDAIAQQSGRDPAQLLQQTRSATRRQHNTERASYRHIAQQVKEVQDERLLPNPVRTDQVIRYEAHLMRQLTQTLTHLHAFQRVRDKSEPAHPRALTDSMPSIDLSEPSPPCPSLPPDYEFDGTNPIPAPLPPSRPESPDQS